MNGLTKFLAALNLLGALVSVFLFSSTFFAQGIITHQIQKIALEKTRSRVEPIIPIAEKLLGNPIANKIIPEKTKERIAQEIADYQSSPDEWLIKLVKDNHERAIDFDFPEIKNPIARKSLDVLKEKVAGARDHFKASTANLVKDLRIFSGVNACSFLIAAVLCLFSRNPKTRTLLSCWSVILMIATIFSMSCYLEQNWIWNFMQNRYLGWEYLISHLVVTGYLILRFLPELLVLIRDQKLRLSCFSYYFPNDFQGMIVVMKMLLWIRAN
jgi:hypothetical protein